MPRLDTLLVERGLTASRSRARDAIVEGRVEVDGRIETKPGRSLPHAAMIALAAGSDFVSRAALKLMAALDHFAIDPTGKTALDIGASTGGFTEMLLVRGAARVYAVDVGTGQLAAKLAADPRVVSLEQLNARDLTAAHVPEPVDIITCDASFIGLETILPAPLALAAPEAILVALIKPQFEVGPGIVDDRGVVTDVQARDAACRRIARWLDGQAAWRVEGMIESPILGRNGNQEFLVCARRR